MCGPFFVCASISKLCVYAPVCTVQCVCMSVWETGWAETVALCCRCQGFRSARLAVPTVTLSFFIRSFTFSLVSYEAVLLHCIMMLNVKPLRYISLLFNCLYYAYVLEDTITCTKFHGGIMFYPGLFLPWYRYHTCPLAKRQIFQYYFQQNGYFHDRVSFIIRIKTWKIKPDEPEGKDGSCTYFERVNFQGILYVNVVDITFDLYCLIW